MCTLRSGVDPKQGTPKSLSQVSGDFNEMAPKTEAEMQWEHIQIFIADVYTYI